MYKHADIYASYLLEGVDFLQAAADVVVQDF